MTKRKNTYRGGPPKRRAPAPAADAPPVERPTLATINLKATTGRAGLKVGDRVRIESAGSYSGETAVIERLTSGPIPGALVRSESGGARQVRTIDLVPLADQPSSDES